MNNLVLKISMFFSLAIFLVLLNSNQVAAAMCIPGTTTVGPSCGNGSEHINSTFGYGAVEICGECYPCGYSDGVCPEDFQDGQNSLVADCSNCNDPDCGAILQGYVQDINNWTPIFDVEVKATAKNLGLQSYTVTTDPTGFYNFTTLIPSGLYDVKATKEGYDTEIKEVRLYKGLNPDLNFTLPDASCKADCTNFFGRCSAGCDGLLGCSYNSTEIKDLCEDRLGGDWIPLNESGNSTTLIQCCTGQNQRVEYRPSFTIEGDVSTLVNIYLPCTLDGLPCKIGIATWLPE